METGQELVLELLNSNGSVRFSSSLLRFEDQLWGIKGEFVQSGGQERGIVFVIPGVLEK